jgi:hypothetical protein
MMNFKNIFKQNIIVRDTRVCPLCGAVYTAREVRETYKDCTMCLGSDVSLQQNIWNISDDLYALNGHSDRDTLVTAITLDDLHFRYMLVQKHEHFFSSYRKLILDWRTQAERRIERLDSQIAECKGDVDKAYKDMSILQNQLYGSVYK